MTRGKRIRVIVADDSPFLSRLLAKRLIEEGGFDVPACVNRGRNVMSKIRELRPDAVSLGLNFPDADGLDILSRIMLECPVPVVVVTGASGKFAFRVARAMDLGAADYLLKFIPGRTVDPVEMTRSLAGKLRAAAKTKVFRLRPGGVANTPVAERPAPVAASSSRPPATSIVVIGASTGGPSAVAQLLEELPANFPAAVLVVQHMPPKFTGALAERLDRTCRVPVSEAARGDVLAPSAVKVAPGGFHLSVETGGRIQLHPVASRPGHCPSVDLAMQSALRVFGTETFGVLLTGMGDDGAAALLEIRKSGGDTYVQTLDACAVPGMPGAAVQRGAAAHIALPHEIGKMLVARQWAVSGELRHV